MKSKTILVSLAVWVAAGAVCFGSAFDGTWKLNTKKSHLGRGAERNNTVKYETAFPFKTKVTIDGTDAKGKPSHDEWTGMFDGKDYPVTGDSQSDTRSYSKVDDSTPQFLSGHCSTVSGHRTMSTESNALSRREPAYLS